MNHYEAERLMEMKKAELHCISREGWKTEIEKKRGRLFFLKQAWYENFSGRFCRECLDC